MIYSSTSYIFQPFETIDCMKETGRYNIQTFQIIYCIDKTNDNSLFRFSSVNFAL